MCKCLTNSNYFWPNKIPVNEKLEEKIETYFRNISSCFHFQVLSSDYYDYDDGAEW